MNDSVRDEVRAALARSQELPQRTCPECGRTEATAAEDCPHCGSSYFARPAAERRRRRRIVLTGAAVLVVAVIAGVIALLADKHDREIRDAATHRRLVAEEIVRLKRVQAPHRGAAPELAPPRKPTNAELLRARHALVLAVQDTITRDARARAARGEFKGPISHTECGSILRRPDAIPDDRILTKPIGRFDCVAVKANVGMHGKVVAKLGYAFVAALHFKDFSYVWCRNSPAQSERGKALAFVRLARPCLAAKGRALGSGYIDTDG